MKKGRWFHFIIPLFFQLLTQCRVSLSRAPKTVDFFYDPLLPRINDTLVLEVLDDEDSSSNQVTPTSYRWFYRELGSPVDAFKQIGIGKYIGYNITKNYRDGYFMLQVISCCDTAGKFHKRENSKLIRIQRPLTVEVFLNGNPLPGNQSMSTLAVPQERYTMSIECRISGMPTNFIVKPPRGVACGEYKTYNRLHYVSAVRRKCNFLPGTFKCTANNDLSRVTMVHFVEKVTPRKKNKRKNKTTKVPLWKYSPTPFSTKDKDIEEINTNEGSTSWDSEPYNPKTPTSVVRVSKEEKNPEYPVVKSVGTKKNNARQCNTGYSTLTIATLTWLVSIRN